jgi:protein O-GlcNAc transferase
MQIPTAGAVMLDAAGRALAAGRPELALAIARDVLRTGTQEEARAHHLAGLAARSAGDGAAALDHLRRAAELSPGREEIWLDLAGLLRAAGRNDDASGALRHALALAPSDPDTWYDLGNARIDLGDGEGAVASWRRALSLRPGHRGALQNLAVTLTALGRREAAAEPLRRALALEPEAADLQLLFARQRIDAGAVDEARDALLRLFDLDPGSVDPELCRSVSTALRDAGRNGEAAFLIRRAIALHPGNATLHQHLGVTLSRMQDLAGSTAAFRHAALLDPAHAFALNSYGIGLCTLGQVEAGVRAIARAHRIEPWHTALHSNLALNLQYHPDATADELLAVHRDWDARHGAVWLPPDPAWDRIPGRKLRIGYVSPDFGQHPVGFFVRDVVALHDRSRFEVVCYSNRTDEDPVTAQIRARADLWVPCASMSHEELAFRIRADRIDILVDLAGHTQGNRLPVFAVKPAPVQASWAGYVGTTGLAAMDWLISDARQSPPEQDAFSVERIMRLPDCYVCYSPPDYAPEVGPPPFQRNGFVTFGCFNNLAKLNGKVVALWARLLRGRTDRRLRLQTRALAVPQARRALAAAFEAEGVPASQVDLLPGGFHRQFLDAYNEIDLALDPFPYSGGLTTLEALWMGVPVVTFGGGRFCSRHSVSHLTAAGVPELAADDPEGCLALASDLADDPRRVASYRERLRPLMRRSPLLDHALFTRRLEEAFAAMWRDWCNGGGTSRTPRRDCPDGGMLV